MPVDRCICHNVPFATLHTLALRDQSGLIGLARQTGCGTGCGLCVPYVRMMLKTGRRSFPVMSLWQFEQLLGPHCCEFAEAASIKAEREANLQKESGPSKIEGPQS